jgi:outer membrane protein assembly factor BamA
MLPGYEKTGRLQLTGELDLLLMSTLGRGESFYFGWRAPEPRSQELEINVGWPYIFSTAVGAGFRFDLLKQDTSYLSLNPVLDLRFYLGGGSYLKAFFDHFSSSLINTQDMQAAAALPPQADVSSTLYGLGISYSSLDRPLNPSRGWDVEGGMGIGSRRIRKNSSLPETLYEGVDLHTTKIRSTAGISYFHPLAGRFVLHISGRAGLIRNAQLFENELFRLGGMHSLRGVDENSILASAYGFGTLETRFLFDQGSAFFLFFDGGYYEKDVKTDFKSDYPLGFGAGIQLETQAGIFLLNYALGRQFHNPINISQAKIHLGYQNRF